MWTRGDWNEIDNEKPMQRTVEITLDEYRELVRESAEHDKTVSKKDEQIYELRRKVEKLTNALSEIDRDDADDADDGE